MCDEVLKDETKVDEKKEKKRLSILSLISFIVSVVSFGLYAVALENGIVYIEWVISCFAAVILPPIAKAVRLDKNKGGSVFEILAIVLGGFDFYCFIFAGTGAKVPIFIGYMGWIISGLCYKAIKKTEENQ